MLELILDTNVIFYLMVAVGVIGAMAKVISRFTVRRLVRAAASMQKSTHKLMKLVRSKYEHACMAHDKVDNTEAFVEKFIFEYRTLGLRLHTWQMMQWQSIWFITILTVVGAGAHYFASGAGEMMYRYAMTGIAEIVLLTTIYQLSDERYKLNIVQVYMVDYLENIHAYRYQKMKQNEKEKLNIINPEAFAQTVDKAAAKEALAINIERASDRPKKESGLFGRGESKRASVRKIMKSVPKEENKVKDAEMELDLSDAEDMTDEELASLGDKEVVKEVAKAAETQSEESSLRVDAIRHILEEFLA